MDKMFKKPDLNKPRFCQKNISLIDDDFLERFREKNPDMPEYNKTQFKNIIKAFNIKVTDQVIERRDGIELPEKIGYIFIGSCQRPKKENIDFGKSIKYGMKVIHSNIGSDSYLGKIFYSNYDNRYMFNNRELWQFKPSRLFSRTVAKTYPDTWQMYIVVDSMHKISRIMKEERRKIQKNYLTNRALQNYNEFDI
jgi:hypothetical protein